MSVLVIPNVLVNGLGPANLVDATGLNANFNAIATAVNNIYPSQILPLTSGQATFGATAVGVGYRFSANDATATPLTVSGVTSQSVDIFRVELTSGGTKAVFVGAPGQLSFASLGSVGPNGPWITGGSSGALILNTTGSQPIFFSSGNLAATTLGQFTTTGVLAVGATPTGPTAAGCIITSTGAAKGFVGFGSGAAWASVDYGDTTLGHFSFRTTADTAYAPVDGGAYTNASDAAFKSDIAPIKYGLAEIMALKPYGFTVKDTGKPGLGFTYQDVQQVLPEITRLDGNGMGGVCYDGIIPVLVKAFQEYVAAHP